ncbi:hypothetical protein MMC08_008053, partial [Hypocenomyce scalaris]|nr:hypothetical protein [Hypocenomyce scalaris]
MPQLVWLITGCSSGFGEQFVRRVTARGDKCIATARSLDKIRHLRDTGAALLPLDVTGAQEELDAKVAEALAVYGRVDVL